MGEQYESMSTEVSTHSRLKAAARSIEISNLFKAVSTHSRLKAAEMQTWQIRIVGMFQHTAA